MDFARYQLEYQLDDTFGREVLVAGSYDVVRSLELLAKDNLIAMLGRDLSKAHVEINVLKDEKARILKEKNNEMEILKKKIETLEKVPIQNVQHIVIATQNNTECENIMTASNHRTVSYPKGESRGESSVLKADSSKINVVKKKTTKKHKDIDVSSIAYNLRSRTIVKSNETIGNNYSLHN